jgi:hypothetical protein
MKNHHRMSKKHMKSHLISKNNLFIIISIIIFGCNQKDNHKLVVNKIGLNLSDRLQIDYCELLNNTLYTYPKVTLISIKGDRGELQSLMDSLNLVKYSDSLSGNRARSLFDPYAGEKFWLIKSAYAQSKTKEIKWWNPIISSYKENYAAYYFGKGIGKTTFDDNQQWNGRIVAQIVNANLFLLIEERQDPRSAKK